MLATLPDAQENLVVFVFGMSVPTTVRCLLQMLQYPRWSQ